MPNVGIVDVPDERLDKLAEMYHPKKVTHAYIEFVDIAGLVKGASKAVSYTHLAPVVIRLYPAYEILETVILTSFEKT